MEPPFPNWHDHSTPETERYELAVEGPIRAIVTRQRLPHVTPDYQAAIEIQGQLTSAPTPFPTRSAAQEWTLRAIEQRWLRQSKRIA